MKIRSTAFEPGERIPRRNTCDGEDVSPELQWSGAPDGTRGFALIMDDPDAPPGTWVHWVLYDLPADTTSLPGGRRGEGGTAGRGTEGRSWGVDRFSRVGYHGPCPPPGKPHRYVFRLYALDRELDLPPRSTKDDVVRAMQGHVLAEAELIGTYGR